MNETVVSNMPTLAIWVIALALVVFAASTMMIAFVGISLLGSVRKLLEEMNVVAKDMTTMSKHCTSITQQTEERYPKLLDACEREIPLIKETLLRGEVAEDKVVEGEAAETTKPDVKTSVSSQDAKILGETGFL